MVTTPNLAAVPRRFGRADNSGGAAAGAGTIVGLRPSSVPAPAAVFSCDRMLGVTTMLFSCAQV